jgi:hypothetical protein
MIWPFKRKRPDIEFKAVIGRPDLYAPIVPARKVCPEWARRQREASKKVNLAQCPGMFDFAHAGYIVPAWCDIHIKANRAGVVIQLDGSLASLPGLSALPMDFSIIDGLAPIEDSVQRRAFKLPGPWSVQTAPGVSCYVVPALMHSDFLDKIYVYPGAVDYETFHTLNLMFSVLKECEFTIPAGTPLLQVIPFHQHTFEATCGNGDQDAKDRFTFQMPSRVKGYYRKVHHRKKRYEMRGTP